MTRNFRNSRERKAPGLVEWKRADYFRTKAVFASKEGRRTDAMKAFAAARKWRRAALDEGFVPRGREGRGILANEALELERLGVLMIDALEALDLEAADRHKAALHLIGRRRAKRESWRRWKEEGMDVSWVEILNGA